MDGDENTAPQRVSHLRPPSKVSATPGRSLYEISESENNARAATMMPPPSGVGFKHKPSGLPEPAPKRKTLAERAGEVQHSNPAAPPSSRPVALQAQANANAAFRHSSYSSYGTSRSNSGSSRNISGASLASSYSAGTRPGSAASYSRPQSAMAFNKIGVVPPTSIARPSTALETHHEDAHGELRPGKRKGVIPVSSSPLDSSRIAMRKQRGRHNHQGGVIYMPSHGGGSTTAPAPKGQSVNPFRELSITSSMQKLSIKTDSSTFSTAQRANCDSKAPSTPSYIPRTVLQTPVSANSKSAVSMKRTCKSVTPSKPGAYRPFLSKYSNVTAAEESRASLEGRLDRFEQNFSAWKEEMETASKSERNNVQELTAQVEIYKTKSTSLSEIRKRVQPLLASLQRGSPTAVKLTHGLVSAVNELESIRSQLAVNNASLQTELEGAKSRLAAANIDLERAQRNHSIDVDELKRKHRNEVEDVRDQHRKEDDRSRKEAQEEVDRLLRQHRDELADLEKRLKAQIEDEKNQRQREVQHISSQLAVQKQDAELNAGNKDREAQDLKLELERRGADLEQEKALNTSLKHKLTAAAAERATIEAELQAMKDKATFLESDSQAQSQAFAELHRQTQEAIQAAAEANSKLRSEETLRRKLHNQVQELKGNIRVFCRVRPVLSADEDEAAKMSYPDERDESKELVVMGPEQKSALGNITTSKNAFSFDRVFGQSSQNLEIFEEINQLVQSALDGYNVCIFCYGQTGSGKTYTMSSSDGMIPLAVHQIYDTAKHLEEKGWHYKMEGSFVEVYNENLNDLLGKAEELDKKKYEIRHDNQKGKTTITDINTVMLDSPETLSSLLNRASANRSVAATKANERSSRSHSVFILKLAGANSITGESSEGTLNLVDLAGSERLNQSGATGDRLKETQNINRSLSCLGDVISALGQGKDGGHIPYRNSKLTYLLQHSLGGNSKTLMFVMVSPLQVHLSETLTSLKFATKVHNTHIGTAKRQTKVRDAA